MARGCYLATVLWLVTGPFGFWAASLLTMHCGSFLGGRWFMSSSASQ
jgi:hypothetical protein